MSSSGYRLLRTLDYRQAVTWLAELTGVGLDPGKMTQACADAGMPAEIAVDGLYLQTNCWQPIEASGSHRVVEASLDDPYKPSLRITVELDDGLLAMGVIDLRERSPRYLPAAIEALAAPLVERTTTDPEIEALREELARERQVRQALEEHLATFQEKSLDPRERRSVTQIIGALAQLAGLDTTSPYKAASTLAHSAAGKLEVPTETTIAKWINCSQASQPPTI
jgi:hypothetical protein